MALTVQDRCVALLADLPPKAPAWDWNLALYGSMIAVALLVGAWIIALAGKWRRAVARRGQLTSPSDQLAHFRTLYDQGAISAEEFERLRDLLMKQMRQALDLPTAHPKADHTPENLHPDDARPANPPVPPPDGVRPD